MMNAPRMILMVRSAAQIQNDDHCSHDLMTDWNRQRSAYNAMQKKGWREANGAKCLSVMLECFSLAQRP